MQILQQRPETFKHLKPEFDLQGGDFFTFWKCHSRDVEDLTKILDDPISEDVYCIVDALDESDEESRQLFLSHFKDLFNDTGNAGCKGAKFLLTSRPLGSQQEQLKSCNIQFLDIEGDALSSDLEKFIEAKVN
jgi:hypothetical protein